MPKIAKPLTDLQVRRITRVGWHAVGGVAGLLLQVRNPAKEGAQIPRSWILRVKVGDQRQPIGLGPYPQVSLSEAREHAKKLVVEAKQGVNLKTKKRAERSALLLAASKNKTFRECAVAYMEAHASDYTNDKHRKQWPATLEAYAYPLIGNMLVSDIAMRDVKNVLEQETTTADGQTGKMWFVKTETAKRLLGRIKTVLDFATVNEYRNGNNPAQWTGYLDTQLPSPKRLQKVEHHPAVPYVMMGDFMLNLRKNDSISAKALEFLILTAVRSGSVRMAEWSEFDLDRKLWVIPAEHTKARQEHRVPLQQQAIKLLKSLPLMVGTNIVFASPTGKSLSDMALSQLMRGMLQRGELPVVAVPHGFRSTFRDWAADLTNYPDDMRKIASGHTVSDSVKKAYERTDLLEKRRQLMNEWATYLNIANRDSTGNVTSIRRKQL
ncbi:XerC Integrase [Burkholderiaceae bacterium]|jgi:integrase